MEMWESSAEILKFLALPPDLRMKMLGPYRDAPWTSLADGKVTKLLLREFEERIGYLSSNDDWCRILEFDPLLREIESLLELVMLGASRFASIDQRMFGEVDAMASDPVWLLMWRLAKEMVALLEINAMANEHFDIPRLLTGVL